MRRVARIGAVVAALTAISGCGGADDDGESQETVVEVFSWWTEGGEKEALEALINVHQSLHPNTRVINAATKTSGAARDELERRMLESEPPDTFQANIGSPLGDWVVFNGSDDAQSKVEPLTDLAQANGWASVLPPAIVKNLSFYGKPYAVPANIHRLNVLYYDKAFFADNSLQLPTSFDDLLTLCETIKTNHSKPCLSLGTKNHWTLALLAFENIFVGQAGVAAYEDYFRGKRTPNDPSMVAAIDKLLQLWPYIHPSAAQVDWSQGVDLFINGEAPMTVMGDWAKGYLQTKGKTPDQEFGQIPFPGSTGTFVFTADVFPLPKGAPSPAAARAFLTTIGSVEGQTAFNLLKGSIPARTDIDPTRFDALGQRTIADFKSSELTMALSGTAPSEFTDNVNPALSESMAAGNSDAILQQLALWYDVLGAPTVP